MRGNRSARVTQRSNAAPRPRLGARDDPFRLLPAIRTATALLLALPLLTAFLAAPTGRLVVAASLAADSSERAGAAPAGPGLRPFPAGAAPFDAAGRRELALDALTFFPRQQGVFAGRFVYQLPVPDWVAGVAPRTSPQTFAVAIPGSTPLYLLAAADPGGRLDPSTIAVLVDGVPLPGIAAYAHEGVDASFAGRRSLYAVLDLVFAPPPAGHYRVEVRERTGGATAAVRSGNSPDDADAGETEEDPGVVLLVYDLDVLPPDALGPLLLRDVSGRTFALLGGERRRVPDEETARLLGFGAGNTFPASAEALAAVPEGIPLPALHDGMLLRAEGDSAVFRLQGGRRVWLGAGDGWNSWDDWAGPPVGPAANGLRSVPAPVLQTIPPLLVDGLLIRTAGPDLFNVYRQSLRKLPDWEWAEEHGFTQGGLLYVPDRVLRALPEGSPYWVRAGGTGTDRVFASASLGRPMPYRVYLPPGYDGAGEAGRRYPVLYLLHGFSGRYDEWVGYGAEQVANELLVDGTFVPAIIVMPQGGLGYWLDEANGGPRWAEYVARDLVAHVDATYRTIPQREARAIGGLSMGGHGALQVALNYPDVFGIAGAHSPSFRAPGEAPPSFGTGEEFARRDPLGLIAASSLEQPPAIWIDAGENDPWRENAEALHRALDEKGWPHEWHVLPGEHDGWYWDEHLWEYLPYYAARFQENGVAGPPQ